MSILRPVSAAALLAACLGGVCAASESFALVREGKPAATIVLSKEAGSVPWFAAAELRDHVKMLSGAELPILTDAQEVAGPRILVGESRLTAALGLRSRDFGPQEYLIGLRPGALILMGRDPEDDPFPVRVHGALRRAEGKTGWSLEIGGPCQALTVTGHGFSDAAGTLEAWVWLGQDRPEAGTIFRLDGSPWTYHIVDLQGRGIRYLVYDGKEGRSVTSKPLEDGWHHFAATHDAAAGRMELFVDGAGCGTAPFPATTCAVAVALHIGALVADGKASNRFKGLIDDVRLSKTVRTPPAGGPAGPTRPEADTLVLLTFDEESGPPRESSGRPRAPVTPSLDDAFTPQGTSYAVHDFLERSCGVRWYAPGPLGMVVPKRATLEVTGPDIRRRPQFEFRHHAPSGIGMAAHGMVPQPSAEDLRLYVARRRLGGKDWMTNHSFYDYYDRFWEKSAERPAIFEGRRQEFFAKGYDGRPPQLCYTSPELVAQVVADGRKALDAGADSIPLVPMDNDQQCRCAGCQGLLDKENRSRQFSTGKSSGLFWTFANAVAKELRKSHPDRFVRTIAYYDYAFPPRFDLEPNILVGPCLHSRNWWCPAMERNDMAFYTGWCAKTPGRLACVWLYQCFPDETGDVNGFRAFPGFHAHTLSRQFKRFAADGVRGFFLCGVAAYVDGYLTFRSLDDPGFDVDAALEEFFTGYYGPAAPPMKRLYLDIERTFMDPANYPEAVRTEDAHYHQVQEIAWKFLGTAERMAAWAGILEEAKAAAGSADQKARVAVFEKDLWGRMLEGRKQWEAKAGK